MMYGVGLCSMHVYMMLTLVYMYVVCVCTDSLCRNVPTRIDSVYMNVYMHVLYSYAYSFACCMVFPSNCRPEDCPDKLHLIMHRCQEHDSEDRPSFSAIRQSLRRERLKTRNERLTTNREQKLGEREKTPKGVCNGMDTEKS